MIELLQKCISDQTLSLAESQLKELDPEIWCTLFLQVKGLFKKLQVDFTAVNLDEIREYPYTSQLGSLSIICRVLIT